MVDRIRNVTGVLLAVLLAVVAFNMVSTFRNRPASEPTNLAEPPPLLTIEQQAGCEKIYKQVVANSVVKKVRGRRIDVDDAAWDGMSADAKTMLLSVIACHEFRAPVAKLTYSQHTVAYGDRSGKRLAMLTSMGMTFE